MKTWLWCKEAEYLILDDLADKNRKNLPYGRLLWFFVSSWFSFFPPPTPYITQKNAFSLRSERTLFTSFCALQDLLSVRTILSHTLGKGGTEKAEELPGSLLKWCHRVSKLHDIHRLLARVSAASWVYCWVSSSKLVCTGLNSPFQDNSKGRSSDLHGPLLLPSSEVCITLFRSSTPNFIPVKKKKTKKMQDSS